MFVRPDNWNSLSLTDRQGLRLDAWQRTDGIEFENGDAASGYAERIGRLRAAIELRKPDRIIADMGFGAEHTVRRKGFTGKDMVYNSAPLVEPVVAFHREFQPDLAVPLFFYPGQVLDTLGLNTYIWSGQKLPDGQVIQAVEDVYMTADEYKDFTHNPSGFWVQKYLPRMFANLPGLAAMPDWPLISEIVNVSGMVAPFGDPAVQETLHTLMRAGEQNREYLATLMGMDAQLKAAGYPSLATSFLKTPFDFLGDTLRGTKGILSDIRRCPNDLKAACEAYVPVLVDSITKQCDTFNAPVAMWPLHKGADSFMSPAQFNEFYWPTFKAVMLGLWEEGITNYLFVEGTYDARLETLTEMPKGSCMWHFDQSDMARVKDVLAQQFTILGNVPASIMATGSADDVRRTCDALVELFEDAPGYVMAFGCGFEHSTDENFIAFRDSVRR